MPYKRLRLERPRYAGMVAAIGGILVTWMLSLAGFFDILNHPLYDALTRFSPVAGQNPMSLLLVEYDDDDDTPETWPLLLTQLQVHQPAQVIFTSLPRQAPPQFYTRAANYGNALFGRRVLHRAAEDGTSFLEVLPASVPDRFASFGMVENPPANYGIHRHQHAAFLLDGRSYPALEVMAWSLRHGGKVHLPTQPYRINFNGGRHQLPRVSIQRVLAGGLVPELVRGRSVLIGPDTSSQIAGLYTPLDPHQASISMLEFHGFALHTLLSGSMIQEPGRLMRLSVIFIIASANLFIYQWITIRLSSWITFALMSLYVGVAWAVLTYAYVWLPTAEILVSQMGVFLLVFREKSVVREFSLQRMLRHASAQLQDPSADASFHTSAEHWSQVVTMLVQTLDLNRLILLDRVPGDHRLREVMAWQCSLEDISEQRRDYHRTPYSTAIKERGLTKAVERKFFTVSTPTEAQYLMPLIFSGDVLGFWAFGIEPDIAAAIPKFKTVVEEFGNQIATLLYRRQEWLTLNASEQHQTLQRYLQLEGGDRTYHALNRSVTLLSQRLKRLENVFTHLGVATVVYNLFGNVLQVNKQMAACLSASSLPPYDLTVFDLIVKLCGLDSGEARRLMRRIVLEKDTVALPATLPISPEHTYVLQLRPIVFADSDPNTDLEDAYPFHIMGIVCELIDVTDLKQMHKSKIQLIERICLQVREELCSLIQDMTLIDRAAPIDPQRQKVMIALKNITTGFLSALDKSFSILNVEVVKQDSDVYPISIKDMIELCLNSYQHDDPFKHIPFQTHIPNIESLGFASPIELKYAIRAVLDFLIDDSVENSDVVIAIDERDAHIVCTFSNSGFGMPIDRLHDYLEGGGDVNSEKFARLRQTIEYVHNWGGTFESWSEIGVGVRFQFKLKGFM